METAQQCSGRREPFLYFNSVKFKEVAWLLGFALGSDEEYLSLHRIPVSVEGLLSYSKGSGPSKAFEPGNGPSSAHSR